MKVNRFNEHYIQEDLEAFLRTEVAAGREGSYSNILQWIKEYEKGIEEFIPSVIKRFEEICKGAIVEWGYSPEGDPCDLRMCIYGIERGWKTPLHDALYDLCRDIEEELEEKYHLIPSCNTDESTEKYYPEIWKKVLELRKTKTQ